MTLILVLGVLAFMVVVMAGGWLVQRAARNGGWVDVAWTYGTGVACCAAALWPTGEGWIVRQALVAALVAAWSLRLGTYIAIRVARSPHEDARYVELREQWGAKFQPTLFGFMQLQAPCTALLAVSVVIAAHHPAGQLRWQDLAGVLILATAILGEGVADAQMQRFKADKSNHGKVNDKGLWAWSRHPNYFFEWFGWCAYPVIAIDPARPWTFAALAGPVAMYLILTRLTGVPALERHMAASKGAAWTDYTARVGAFFPRPSRKAQP